MVLVVIRSNRDKQQEKNAPPLDSTLSVRIIESTDGKLACNQTWCVPIRGEATLHPLVHNRGTSWQQERITGEYSLYPESRLSSCAAGAS